MDQQPLKTNMTVDTKIERLEELQEKVKQVPLPHLKRRCSGGICGCLGCANIYFSSKNEWVNYSKWIDAGCPK